MVSNYYDDLNVDSEAKQDQIKAAYRQAVLKYHPDHYGEDSRPFLAVQEAYSVLGDPARREAYDATLRFRNPVRGQYRAPARPEPLRAEQPEPLIPEEPAPLGDISLLRSFETFSPSFEEIVHRLWGNFGSVTRPKAERLESLTVEIPITSSEAMRGGTARVLIPVRCPCQVCRGQGGVGPFECLRCTGTGAMTGEYPLAISFPAGIPDNYPLRYSLERFSIHNLYLTVLFRIRA
jgi:DnaJ-class molecular chaperone